MVTFSPSSRQPSRDRWKERQAKYNILDKLNKQDKEKAPPNNVQK